MVDGSVGSSVLIDKSNVHKRNVHDVELSTCIQFAAFTCCPACLKLLSRFIDWSNVYNSMTTLVR
jgi:hypothetical protein